ncbi:MAG: histidine phosphatase family protein [Bacteroidia bacterium]
MKTLILIRHAKSSWKFPELKDIDRPLNKRGLNDAPLMGKILKGLNLMPDLIMSSPSVRTISTAKMIAQEVGFNADQIVAAPGIYLESKSKLLKEINKIDDRYATVFIVCHNPGITDLANFLTGESLDNIPTCGAFGIQFESNSWKDVDKKTGKKMFFEFPKKHKKKVEKTKKQVL